MNQHHFTPQERLQIGQMIMVLFDKWAVPPELRIQLLGLPASTKKRSLDRFRQQTPLPDEPQLFERIEYLVAIHESLLTTYPHNHAMVKIWLHARNRRFRRYTPLQWMAQQEMAGIRQVLGHLDCTTQWY